MSHNILRIRNLEMIRLRTQLISAVTLSAAKIGMLVKKLLIYSQKVLCCHYWSQHLEMAHGQTWQKNMKSIIHTLVRKKPPLQFKILTYCILALTRAIATQKNLVKCLAEIDPRYKPEQTDPIYKLLAKLNDLAVIFINCLNQQQKSEQ